MYTIFNYPNLLYVSGYIIQKREFRPSLTGEENEEFLTYTEFHPILLKQCENKPYQVIGQVFCEKFEVLSSIKWF